MNTQSLVEQKEAIEEAFSFLAGKGHSQSQTRWTGDPKLGASPSLNRIYKAHEMLTVEPRVMDLLMLLAESPGQVFGRDEILQRVWPETTVQDDALRRVVTLLRRVLDDDPKEPRYIETITRRGYRLVAPVSRPDPKPNDSVARKTPRLLGGILLLVGLSVATAWLAQRGGAPNTQLDLRPLTSRPGHESDPSVRRVQGQGA